MVVAMMIAIMVSHLWLDLALVLIIIFFFQNLGSLAVGQPDRIVLQRLLIMYLINCYKSGERA